MWKNNLEKADLETKEISLVSLFSGIGAFEKSLTQLGVKSNIENFAEVDIDAILSYAAVHIPNFEDVEFEYDTEENIRNWLMKRNIGFDFAKGKSKIPKLKKDKLYKLYKASVLGKNLGDVSLIKHEKRDIDLIVGGSPCQDFSVAGKLKGSTWSCKECGHEYNPLEQHYSKRSFCPKCNSDKLDKTRSSLLVEYLRAVREIKPKYFVYENVKNIKGKGFISMFNLFEKELEEYGYKTYNEVLNSKNFGIPQNRERVFVVGIRNDIEKEFEFNMGFNSNIKLKDVLENSVDEKYYIKNERANILIEKLKESGQLNSDIVPCDSTIMKPKSLEVANCITARYDAGIQNKQSIGVAVAEKNVVGVIGSTQKNAYVGNGELCSTLTSAMGQGGGHIPMVASRIGGLFDDEKGKHQAGSVWDSECVSPTLDTMQGGYRQPCIVEKIQLPVVCEQRVDEGLSFFKGDVCGTLRTIDTCGDKRVIENGAIRGRYNEEGKIQQQLELRNDGVINTLTTVEKDNVIVKNVSFNDKSETRIRKLTPKECWRLMGFTDEDFEKAQSLGVADSQLYKQAGNSIVTNVLYYIFKNLL